MRGYKSLLAVLFLALTVFITTNAPAQKMKEATVWPAAEIQWKEMKGGPPGVLYADLWGHMEKGPYGSLVKHPPGAKHPLHTHSSDVKLVVLSGTFLYTPEGGTEQRLGPGSYLSIPGGLKHSSGTGEGEPCEVFQESTGKFDMKPVGKSGM